MSAFHIAEISSPDEMAQTFAAGLSVRAEFGPISQTLGELFLLQEVVHHVSDHPSVSQSHRQPVTIPARPDLALLQAENDPARRIIGPVHFRYDLSHQHRDSDHSRGCPEKYSRTRQETRQCQHMSRQAFEDAAKDCHGNESDRAGPPPPDTHGT